MDVKNITRKVYRFFLFFFLKLQYIHSFSYSYDLTTIFINRFRDRVLNLVNNELSHEEPVLEEQKEMHKTIKKVTNDINKLGFNTAISNLMIFTNFLSSMATTTTKTTTTTTISKKPTLTAVKNLVLLLSPFAPHVAEECWQKLGNKKSIAYESWPVYDEQYCIENIVTIAIQINGKVRGKIEVDKSINENDVLEIAKKENKVAKFLGDSVIKKIIFVPGKILNILV
jgi:leucyl-tRNA synthetase